jgi:hypothetical protein
MAGSRKTLAATIPRTIKAETARMTMTSGTAFRRRAMSLSLLVLLLAGCAKAPPSPVGSGSASGTPAATLPAPGQRGVLSIDSPLEDARVPGGGDIRIALYLVDHGGLPVEGAAVRAEVWTPGGELFANLPCEDRGKGRYLSDYASLPLRGAGGTWHVIGKAAWEGGRQAEVEGTFEANPSISEVYHDLYGFWIEHPKIFALGTGFYNLSESGGLHFEDWLNEDGSGYVILDNYRYDAIGVTFATLEIHWRHAEYPADGATAIAFAQSLAGQGLHHQDPDTPITKLTAGTTGFQGRSAWHVLGVGSEYYVSKAAAEYPVEWLIFQCPGSDWLWSLVLSADKEDYVDHLQAVQETFECPPVNAD